MGEETLGEELGHVVDYFAKVGAAGIQLEKGRIKVGDKIRIKGHTTDLEQTIESMQVDNKSVEEAAAPVEVGIKISDKCRKGDKVYKVTE
jgi:putative protease